jgi:hypothetical protein
MARKADMEGLEPPLPSHPIAFQASPISQWLSQSLYFTLQWRRCAHQITPRPHRSIQRDLNSRPSRWQRDTLPTELWMHGNERVGFEPTATPSSVRALRPRGQASSIAASPLVHSGNVHRRIGDTPLRGHIDLQRYPVLRDEGNAIIAILLAFVAGRDHR